MEYSVRDGSQEIGSVQTPYIIGQQFLENILEKIKIKKIDKWELEIPDASQKDGKYNLMIPKNLLKKQFIEDCVDVDNMKNEL